MRKRFIWIWIWMAGMALQAQTRSGDISGKVTRPEGTPLPGVIIILTGSAMSSIEAVTGIQGAFHFPSLPPAEDYRVTAELDGYKKIVCENIRVISGGCSEVRFRMEAGTPAETLTIPYSRPLPDRRVSQETTVFFHREMQSLPIGRDSLAILGLVAGIQLDRGNLVEAEAGQPTAVEAKGQVGREPMDWHLDGIKVTAPSGFEASPSSWDFDTIEEMNVTTAGVDIQAPAGGVKVNMVSRRGHDRFHLGGRFSLADSSFQDDNLTLTLKSMGLTKVNRTLSFKDFGFNFGGPIVKNKIFAWMAVGAQDNRAETILGANDETLTTNYAFKLNIQPFEANRLEAMLFATGRSREGRGVNVAQPFGFGQGNRRHLGSPMIKIQDEHMFGGNMLLSLKYTFSDDGLKMWPMNDPELAHAQWRDMTTTMQTGSYSFDDAQRLRRSYAAQVTYWKDRFLGGAHEVLGGIEYSRASQEISSGDSGSGTTRIRYHFNTPLLDLNGDGNNEVPTGWNRWENFRPQQASQYLTHHSAYLQDSMTYGRFMIRAGVRMDIYQPGLNETSLDGMPVDHSALKEIADEAVLKELDTLFPALKTAAAKPTEFRWFNFSPRLSLTWDIRGNGKMLAKLSLARYGDVMGFDTTDYFRDYGSSGWMNFWWQDANADKKVQFPELFWAYRQGNSDIPYRIFDDTGKFLVIHPAESRNINWGGFDWASADKTQSARQMVDSYKSPTTTEVVAILEKEMSKDLTLSLNGTYRKMNGFSWDLPFWPTDPEHPEAGGVVMDSTWFVPGGVIPDTLPVNGENPSTEEAAGKTWYTPSSKYTPTDWRMLQAQPDYSRTYTSIDLILTKRLSNKWMASGALTFQSQKQKYGDNSILDPTSIWAYNSNTYAPSVGDAFGKIDQHVFSNWMLKLSGLYQIPWGIHFSGIFTMTQGNIRERGFWIVDAKTANPWWTPGSSDVDPRAQWIPLESFGKTRLPILWDVSLRVEKSVPISRNQSLNFTVDVFNVFNNSTTTRQYAEAWGIYYADTKQFVANPTSNVIASVINARLFRFGVRFQF